MKRRMQSREELAAFVLRRCWPTPFLYQLLSCPQPPGETDSRHELCIPCVNWKRRVVQARSVRRKRLPVLQMDQLIYYLLRPGVYPEPDRRCMGRLLVAARQSDNPFRFVFPLPVQTMLVNVRADTPAGCIEAWWGYNGSTEYFASGGEAKRVRALLYHMDV